MKTPKATSPGSNLTNCRITPGQAATIDGLLRRAVKCARFDEVAGLSFAQKLDRVLTLAGGEVQRCEEHRK